MALVCALFQQADGAECFLAVHAEVELFGLVDAANVFLLPNRLCNQLLDGPTPNEIGFGDDGSALGTASVILDGSEKIVEARLALNRRALGTHPHFVQDQIVAYDALAKCFCVDGRLRIHTRFFRQNSFHHISFGE